MRQVKVMSELMGKENGLKAKVRSERHMVHSITPIFVAVGVKGTTNDASIAEVTTSKEMHRVALPQWVSVHIGSKPLKIMESESKKWR